MKNTDHAARLLAAFGPPKTGTADIARARRARAHADGYGAAYDRAAARNSEHLWAEVEAADAEESQ